MLGAKLERLQYALRSEWRGRSRIVDRTFVACVIAVLTLMLQPSILGRRAESMLLRSWFSLRGPRPAPESVVIVQIDSRTKQALGIPDREPISRTAITEALRKVMAYSPQAIIFDAVFEGEGPSPEVDRDLASALAESPSVIARSSLLDIAGRDKDGKPIYERRKTDSYTLFVQSAKFVVPMQATLTENVVEKITLIGDPALEKVPLLLPLRRLVNPAVKEPGDFDLINYYGEPFTISGIPMYRLFEGDEAGLRKFFAGKLVFFGWTERAISGLTADKRDSFMTPVSPSPMYGVEIQATIAANLLDGTWLHRLPLSLELLAVFSCGLILSFVATSMSWRQFVPLIVAGGCAWLLGSFVAFSKFYYFIPGVMLFGVVMPVFALFAAIAEGRREAIKRRELEESIGMLG